MPATAPDCGRRAFLFALAAPLFADTHQEMLDLLRTLADALSQGNASLFLEHVDRSMPDYYKLEQYLEALASQDEVSCSIDFLKQTGSDQEQTLQLDWFLEIHPLTLLGSVDRRRQTVKLSLARKKKKWKIMHLEPVTLFAPPPVR